jgi:transposase
LLLADHCPDAAPGPLGGRGGGRWQIKTFATTTVTLVQRRRWPIGQTVTVVGVQATGDSWKPVYYLSEDEDEVQLVNPAHLHNLPGRKNGCH